MKGGQEAAELDNCFTPRQREKEVAKSKKQEEEQKREEKRIGPNKYI